MLERNHKISNNKEVRMRLIDEQINNLQQSVDKLLQYSYESDVYNSEWGQMLELTSWHIGQNIKTLKETKERIGG